MKTDITVIVPIYNVEKYVSKCLKSLLNQTYKNFEVWAVDDGSPDNSKEIVKEFADKDSRIKLIVKENGGYGSVLEYCIQRITTKYFLICDPDDWLKESALEKLRNFAENNNLDITVGDKYEVYIGNTDQKYISTFPSYLKIKPRVIYTQPEDIQRFAFSEVSPHSKLFKTSVAKNIIFPHKINYTDTILYVISLINSNRVAYYKEALAYYLIDRPGNSTTSFNKKMVDQKLKIWVSIFNQSTSNSRTTSVLMCYLYCLLKVNLSMFADYSMTFYTKNYSAELNSLILKMQKYKKEIAPLIQNSSSILKKILFNGLMNPTLYKIFSRLYIFSKKISK